jgi:microcystin-dependent protein
MSEPFIGEIIMFAGNFAPRGWALCQGQILSIAQNTALFSILGTTYGGNGQTTFALPDLRGRVPLGQGQGPGLSPYVLGQLAGTENTTLLQSQMPAHNHLITANEGNGTAQAPANGFLSAPVVPTQGNAAVSAYRNSSDGTTLAPTSLSISGGNQPFSNLQPYLCINFIIALEGIFPSRN